MATSHVDWTENASGDDLIRRYPASFSQLVAEHWMPGLPRDPLGYPYKLMPDGRIEVFDYNKLPFITKGLPPRQQQSDFDFSRKS